MGSPHKEEKVIGENIDLDLLSLFPQRYARIMGGIERWASFLRSTLEGEREGKTSLPKLKEGEGYLYPSRKYSRSCTAGPDIPVQVWIGYSALPPKTAKDFTRVVQIWGRIFQNWAG
jgi:hypothetical protein